MNRLWSDHVADLSPYSPGEQPRGGVQLLKLNTNEHPQGPSPRVIEAIRAAADDRLRLYPDYEALDLRAAIAAMHGLHADHVFLGNGSDEILAHVFNGLFKHAGRRLLMPDISYSFYRTYCQMYQVAHDAIPLADDYSVRVADYTAARSDVPAGIILANPNAPTGIALTVNQIEQIVRANPDSPVVIDEAYVDFGAESAAKLLDRYENLVVVQTLSKSRSLAGLRVGLALANAGVIEALTRIKDSFNSYPLDRLAQAGALAAIQDTGYFDRARAAVIQARDRLAPRLTALGFEVLPTLANFVFVRHPSFSAVDISGALRERHILVRHFAQPRIAEFLRITVGTQDDCERLCTGLDEILEQFRNQMLGSGT